MDLAALKRSDLEDPAVLRAALEFCLADPGSDVEEDVETPLGRLLALGLPGTPATEEMLFEMIGNPDLVLRALAAASWPDEVAIVRRFVPNLLSAESGLACFGESLGAPGLAALCDLLAESRPEALDSLTTQARTAAAVARALRAKGTPAVPILARCLPHPDARAALQTLAGTGDLRALALLALDDPAASARLRGRPLQGLRGEDWLCHEFGSRTRIPPEFPLLPFLRAVCRSEGDLLYHLQKRVPPWTDELREFVRSGAADWLDRLAGGGYWGITMAHRAGVAPAGTVERIVGWLADLRTDSHRWHDVAEIVPPEALPGLVLRRPDLLPECAPALAKLAGLRDIVVRYVEACEAAPEEETSYGFRVRGLRYGLYAVRGNFAPLELGPLLDAIGADDALRRRVQAVLPRFVRELFK